MFKFLRINKLNSWFFGLKILLQNFSFLAIFLEFFILGNNHTLQDPLYTRSITLILCIERNKKIRLHFKSFANWLETCKSDLYKLDTCKRLAKSSLLSTAKGSKNPKSIGLKIISTWSWIQSRPSHGSWLWQETRFLLWCGLMLASRRCQGSAGTTRSKLSRFHNFPLKIVPFSETLYV